MTEEVPPELKSVTVHGVTSQAIGTGNCSFQVCGNAAFDLHYAILTLVVFFCSFGANLQSLSCLTCVVPQRYGGASVSAIRRPRL